MLAVLSLAVGFSAPSPEAPTLWPSPSSSTPSSGALLTVAPSKTFFALTKGSSPLLAAAFERYTAFTFPHTADTKALSASITSLQLTVDDLAEDHPTLATDESYTIDVSAERATAHAKTVYGALRVLETFSQMVAFDFDAGSYGVPAWKIDDKPRFAHRGLMIDTARHYEPLAAIRGIVDSLPYAKLNVLHWHMSDSQSFPLQSTTAPKLWDGAYSAQERYTQADVASIVEYAKLRGVRVMVEFDMPGHAGSWCAGYPEVCPSTSCVQPLNVASNKTFDLIAGLLGEMTGKASSAPGKPSGLFPSNMIHLGGDEVDTSCWSATADIAAWLAARNMSADDGCADAPALAF